MRLLFLARRLRGRLRNRPHGAPLLPFMQGAPEPELQDAVLMCLAAGIVDAHGYFRLGHVFTANMTGNTVLMSVLSPAARGNT